ncbi:MAG: zinc-ribbon domain-containing protein [Prevotella sp.]|nr:zinc-ribbon domain-containing protein [Prevotella sp.]
MALIKCKQCGHMISDRASKCPKCGASVAKEIVKPQEYSNNEEANSIEEYDEESDSNVTVYILLSLVFVAFFGIGYWWYNHNSGNGEVQQFVEQFVKAVEDNDDATIQELYPNAEKADAMQITYNKDSLSVINTEGSDTIDIRLSYSQSLRIVKDPTNGQMHIVSSKGLFTFPTDKIRFALKTGWINTSLDDIVIKERLGDEKFIPWIEEKAVEEMKAKLRVTKSTVEIGDITYEDGALTTKAVYYEIVIENQNNIDIPGDDYIVRVEVEGTYSEEYYGEETKESYSKSCNSLTGKVIPKKGTTFFSWIGETEYGRHYSMTPERLKCEVIFEPSKSDAIAVYEAKGNEYIEYLKHK